MNLTKTEKQAAANLASMEPTRYLGLARIHVAKLLGVSDKTVARLMTKCGFKLHASFLKWCANGGLSTRLQGIPDEPTPADIALIDAELAQHRKVVKRADWQHIDFTGKPCCNCGATNKPRFLRRGSVMCVKCANIREAAKTTWSDSGIPVNAKERVTLPQVGK